MMEDENLTDGGRRRAGEKDDDDERYLVGEF